MVKRYRNRKTFEAVRLKAGNQREVDQFLWEKHCAVGGGMIPNLLDPSKWAITWSNKGEAGTRTAYEGDYIIRYPDGCVPMEATMFEKLYEEVGRGVLSIEGGGA